MKSRFVAVPAFWLLISGIWTACREDFDFDSQYNKSIDQQYNLYFTELFEQVDPAHTWNTTSLREVTLYVLSPETEASVQIFTSDPRGKRADCYLLSEQQVASDAYETVTFDAPTSLNYVYAGIRTSQGARWVQPICVNDPTTAQLNVNLRSGSSGTTAALTLIRPSATSQPYYYPRSFYTSYTATMNQAHGLCTWFEYASLGRDIYVAPAGNSTEGGRTLCFSVYNPDKLSPAEAAERIAAGTLRSYPILCTDTAALDFAPKETEKYGISRPFIIRNVPLGFRLLFYTVATGGDGSRRYTLASLNAGQAVGAAAMDIDGRTMVRFTRLGDNTNTGGTQPAGQIDLAFGLFGGQLIDYEPADEKNEMAYTVVCEVIRDTLPDMDYNDAVVRLAHVTGRDSLTITGLAVGDTIPIGVAWDGKRVFQELHESFGRDVSVPVNTGRHTAINLPKTQVQVPAGFSITQSASRLSFVASRPTGDVVSLTLPVNGAAPRVMIIANPMWEWPAEGVALQEAYPLFGRYVRNTSNQTWCNAPWSTLNSDITQRSSYLRTDVQPGQ